MAGSLSHVSHRSPSPWTANRKALELMLQNFDLRLPIPRKRSNPTAASQQTAVNL
jgi:hypothetical protein